MKRRGRCHERRSHLLALTIASAIAVAAVPAGSQAEPFREGSTSVVSQSGGSAVDGSRASITPDGRFIAFASFERVTPDDTDTRMDIFRRDTLTGQTILAVPDVEGELPARGHPVISADGRRILYRSGTCSSVTGTCLWEEASVHDLGTGVTVGLRTEACCPTATWGHLSGDGRWAVVIADWYEDGGPFLQIYDATTGVRAWTIDGLSASGCGLDAGWATISGDGRYVAFEACVYPSWDATRRYWDVFLIDRDTDHDGIFDEGGATSTTPMMKGSFSLWPQEARFPTISADGSTIVLVADGSLWAKNVMTGEANVLSDGPLGMEFVAFPTLAVSRDGRFVAFSSEGSLTRDDLNPLSDVFLRDRSTGKTVLVSILPDGTQGAGEREEPAVTGDGRYVVFTAGVRVSSPPLRSVYLRDRSGSCQVSCI